MEKERAEVGEMPEHLALLGLVLNLLQAEKLQLA